MRCKAYSLWLSLSIGACVGAGARQGPDNAERLDGGRPSVPIDAGQGCDLLVADPLIEHSCFHAMVGPYRERDLTAASDAQEVNRPHTAFLLTLPHAGNAYEATVRYDARVSGGYAFFSSRELELSIERQGTQQPLPFFSRHATEICSELPWVQAHQLAAGTHLLRVRSQSAQATLVVEFMDEGPSESSYRASCATPPRPDGGAASERDGGALVGLLDAGGDGAVVQDDAGADGGDCWIDPVLEHTCLHVMHSSPQDVAAGASAAAAPNVNAPHTFYMVQLWTTASHLTYRPVESGEYVFYLGTNVNLELTSGGSPVAATHDEPVSGCAGLARALVYPLTGSTKYDLRLRPMEGTRSTPLLVESVDGLVEGGWEGRWEACE
jgi:hypothetical protein